ALVSEDLKEGLAEDVRKALSEQAFDIQFKAYDEFLSEVVIQMESLKAPAASSSLETFQWAEWVPQALGEKATIKVRIQSKKNSLVLNRTKVVETNLVKADLGQNTDFHFGWSKDITKEK